MRRDLNQRTKQFALQIIKLYQSLPKSTVAQIIGNQVLRSGTSVGEHYREANRSRSNAELISKIEVGLQELEETVYWLELLVESNTIQSIQINAILGEANELNAILTACVKTAKTRKIDH
ncbi:four helix bundle protein [Oscillatoria sp. FACHB-1407]|uniref:four helix bundle protein n=1 Tax=Oscillatoria sp. FACHB-1407 TaxID=2692847 RepID=UPI0016888735|nr:four helix bundle protein [Oscillatoria sp. FACHB-1407]MBD2463995.1 four helix bundle protein [Oscillatoria sp. FACHB-1407]